MSGKWTLRKEFYAWYKFSWDVELPLITDIKFLYLLSDLFVLYLLPKSFIVTLAE